MVKERICVGNKGRKKCDYHSGKIVHKDSKVKIMRFDNGSMPHIIIRDFTTKTRFSIMGGKVKELEF